MAANFLHGIETIERDDGARPIRIVKSGVIALIGTAPTGPVNTLTQCLSERDAAEFGADVPGFTIPSAFDAIFDHGAGRRSGQPKVSMLVPISTSSMAAPI